MNRQTEDRLRAAFDAKADQVTDERLDQLAAQRRRSLVADLDDDTADADDFPAIPGFSEREPFGPGPTVTRLEHPVASPRHARWLAPLLAAAAVVAVAVGVTAVSTSMDNGKRAPLPPASQVSTPAPSSTPEPSSTAPAPSSSSSVTVTPPAYVPLLGTGKQADRSEIPWSQVGPGWHLISSAATSKASTALLYLVNPIGGRYLISEVAADNFIHAWSPDGRRALLSQLADDHTTFTELELATGQVLRTFNLDQHPYFVSYSRPTGQAILVDAPTGKKTAAGEPTFALQRFGTDGRLQQTYPDELPGLGKLVGNSALYSLNGAELLIGGQNGVALLANDGHLIRTLPAPAGLTECRPIKWWDAATVLMRCTHEIKETGGLPTELFLQPVAGGSPTKLGGSVAASHSFVDAWPYSGGLLLREGASCGPGKLDVLRNGVISKLVLPAEIATPTLHAVDGDVAIVENRADCSSEPIPVSVISVNLVTKAQTTLTTGVSRRVLSYPR
ncbi:MAG: hypothetical protein ABIQ09_08215 [Jatrophihabitantaceae bacterium]